MQNWMDCSRSSTLSVHVKTGPLFAVMASRSGQAKLGLEHKLLKYIMHEHTAYGDRASIKTYRALVHHLNTLFSQGNHISNDCT
jgi:hypothetical protein